MDALLTLAHRYAAGAWRRRWIALGVAWLICLLGWAGVMNLPRSYQASAQVYVAADPVLTPLLHGIAIGEGIGAEVGLLQRTLLSRPHLETLIAKADLLHGHDTLAAHEALVKKLGQTIKISPETENLFTISYRNADPKLAYTIVQTMLSIFIERATGMNQADLANAQHFLSQQLALYKDQLRDVEKRRAAFLAKYTQLLPGADGSVSRFDAARTEVRSLEEKLLDAQARVKMLEEELKKTPPMLVTSQGAGGGAAPASAALAQAEQELADLRAHYTEAYPGVIAARHRVEALAAEATGKGPTPMPSVQQSLPNPVYEQLKLQLIDATSTEGSLTRALASATAERDRLSELARSQPGLQAEYINLDRNYEALRKQYQELLARAQSMQITSAANIDANRVQLQVVDPPQLPTIPVGLSRALMLAAVLVVGMGGGICVALGLAHIDSSCYTLHDLRSVGLPVIGAISLRPSGRRPRRVLPTLAFAAGVSLLVVVFAGCIAGARLVGLA